MSIIEQVTKDCQREDCRIVLGGGSSTLLAWTPTFDRHGKQIGSDPNIHTQDVYCRTCRRRWITKTRSGETTITTHSIADAFSPWRSGLPT